MSQTNWIVCAKDKRDRDSKLIAACEGDEKAGQVLQYLIAITSIQENEENLNLQETSSFQLVNFKLDQLATCVRNRFPLISKTTLQRRLKVLESKGYIERSGYHGNYTIFHQTIQHAMDNPPQKKPYHKSATEMVNSNLDHMTTSRDGQNEQVDHLTILVKELVDEVYRLNGCLRAQGETIIELREMVRDGQEMVKTMEERMVNFEAEMVNRWSEMGGRWSLNGQSMVKPDENKSPEAALEEASEGDGQMQHLISNNLLLSNNLTPLPPPTMRRGRGKNNLQKEEKPLQAKLPVSSPCFQDDPHVEKLWITYRAQLDRIGVKMSDKLKQVERESFMKIAGWFIGKPDADFLAYFTTINKKASETQGNYAKYASIGWLANDKNYNNWFISYRPSLSPPQAPEPEFKTLEQQRAEAKAKRDAAGINPLEYLQKRREQGALA